MIWMLGFASAVGAGWLLGHGDAAANARAAAASAPLDLLMALHGVTLGLCGRDRVRLHRAHASPTLAWLAKRAWLGALAGAAVCVLSPVDWPPASLHAFSAAAAFGGALWIGNLPVRL
jgi:hypothetical protein